MVPALRWECHRLEFRLFLHIGLWSAGYCPFSAFAVCVAGAFRFFWMLLFFALFWGLVMVVCLLCIGVGVCFASCAVSCLISGWFVLFSWLFVVFAGYDSRVCFCF